MPPLTLQAQAALCLIPSLALAAAIAPPDAPTALPLPTDATSSGFERWFTDPPQLQLGPVDFHPRLTTGITYDSNIYISSSNPQADEIWSATPGVQMIAGDRQSFAESRLSGSSYLDISAGSLITVPPESWPGTILTLDYGPRFNFYTHASNNNGVDQFATFNTLFPLSRLILGVKQAYSYQSQQVIEAGQRSIQTAFNTALTSGYQLSSRSSLQVNFRRDSYSYSDPSLIGYAQYQNDNWYGFQISERLNLGGGVTAGFVSVNDQPGQAYEQILARAIYRLAEKVNLDASGGVEIRQYDSGAAGTLEPVFSITGSYNPTPTTSFSLNAHRWDQPSVQSGNNYLLTGFSLGGRQQFLDRYSVGLSGGFDNYAYYSTLAVPTSAANQNNNYWSARLDLEYRVNAFLRANLFGRYSQQNYQTSYGGFTDTQVGLSVTYGF